MSRKDMNKEVAIKWCAKLYDDEVWKECTMKSIKNSIVVSKSHLIETGMTKVNIVCSPNTSTACAEEYIKKNVKSIGILNFSSYFNPGGDFLKGSISQEESLCHKSNLYNILSGLDIYKDRRCYHGLTGLYGDDAILTPDVKFVGVDGVEYFADVISVSAPNCNRNDFENKDKVAALHNRIETVLSIANDKQYDVLILGAWGCGALNNDPTEIAEVFRYFFKNFNIKVGEVVFAIPNTKLLCVFEEVLSRM